MSKINVLVFPSDRTGVSKFRSVEPHMKLQELYNDDFYIEIITAGTDNFSWDESFLRKFDIIHFHRTLPMIKNGVLMQVYMDDMFNILEKIHSLGIITVMDLDDYWEPTIEHPAHQMIVKEKLPQKIKENIKRVNYVTTTTPIFANEIKKLNQNVVVLPNAIDPSEKQFTPNTEKTDKQMRFGWLGGSSHYFDLKIIESGVSRFLGENIDDTQMVLCGFDIRGNVTEIDRNTGEQKTRKIMPQESVWARYEEMFTKTYSLLSEDYINQLKKYDESGDKKYNNSIEPYRRVWTKPITSYASNYNLFDVSMAPLKEHMFNKVKSQLKVIEAGFHKKALISQNFGPYQIDCVNMFEYGGNINEKGNAILIDTSKNHKDWYKALKKLKENPTLVELLSHNLYETVKDKYHIDTVTHQRAELYKTILNDNRKEVEQLIEHNNAI